MVQRSTAVSWFLGIVGVLAVVGGIAVYTFHFHPFFFFRLSFVPSTPFAQEIETPMADYSGPDGWFSYGTQKRQAAMTPGDATPDSVDGVDVFFIHPTTYLNAARWNAPLDDEDSQYRTQWYVIKNQTSAFNAADRIYAPRYRQATFGAFFDESGQGLLALQRAQADVRAAFDTYIETQNNGRPFILAGHSQGAWHSLFLLKDRISGTPIADQLVAAYVVGWPVGIKTDMVTFPDIPACQTPTDMKCIISWQSFIGPDLKGDPGQIVEIFKASPGLNGMIRSADSMLCTNPLTWVPGSKGEAGLNLGAVPGLQSEDPLPPAVPGFVGAACDADGILILDQDPQGQPWIDKRLPGKNMHVHDITLFYMNVQNNVAVRARQALSQP